MSRKCKAKFYVEQATIGESRKDPVGQTLVTIDVRLAGHGEHIYGNLTFEVLEERVHEWQLKSWRGPFQDIRRPVADWLGIGD